MYNNLLILLSSIDAPISNTFLNLFVNEGYNTNSWELFCSLLNTSLTYDPVGWGLPYNYLLSSDDSAEILVGVSLQTLLLLLNRHQTTSSNIFLIYLRAMGKESNDDFHFLYSHISTLFVNPLETTRTYLPGSSKAIESQEELLLLFWTIISCSSNFVQYILTKEDLTLITGTIIYFMLENRRNDGKNHNYIF